MITGQELSSNLMEDYLESNNTIISVLNYTEWNTVEATHSPYSQYSIILNGTQ